MVKPWHFNMVVISILDTIDGFTIVLPSDDIAEPFLAKKYGCTVKLQYFEMYPVTVSCVYCQKT